MADRVILGQQFTARPQSLNDLVEDRIGECSGHFLRHKRSGESLLADDLALVGFQIAVDQPHQRRLAHAVATQQADAFARVDLQVRPIQEQRPPEPQIHIPHTQ